MDDCNVIILDALKTIWRRPEGSKVLGASDRLLTVGRLERGPGRLRCLKGGRTLKHPRITPYYAFQHNF